MQGLITAGIKCSVSIDSIGRETLSSDRALTLYTYKGAVDIPPVSFIDDCLGVSKDGTDAVELNAFLNSEMETKKLTLRADKCITTKVQTKKKQPSKANPTLKVHDEVMKEGEKFKYLGD